MESTLLLIKPDGVERGLIGKIISTVERANFDIVNLTMKHLKKDEAEDFYSVHADKHFFKDLIQFVTRNRIVAMEVVGKNAVKKIRSLVGDTDPAEAEEHTIRGRFGLNETENTVHASDSPENALREIKFFFKGRKD